MCGTTRRMRYGMACKPGDLVLIPFPYSLPPTPTSSSPLSPTPPDRHEDFIGLAITSVEHKQAAIQIGTANLIHGTLPKPCWIRFDKVFTHSESSIVKTFGAVSPPFLPLAISHTRYAISSSYGGRDFLEENRYPSRPIDLRNPSLSSFLS